MQLFSKKFNPYLNNIQKLNICPHLSLKNTRFSLIFYASSSNKRTKLTSHTRGQLLMLRAQRQNNILAYNSETDFSAPTRHSLNVGLRSATQLLQDLPLCGYVAETLLHMLTGLRIFLVRIKELLAFRRQHVTLGLTLETN